MSAKSVENDGATTTSSQSKLFSYFKKRIEKEERPQENDAKKLTKAGQPELFLQAKNKANSFSDDKILEVEADVTNNANGKQTSYYLENFLLILKTVLNDEEHRHLFNLDELQMIATFQHLNSSTKKLYVRLFQRKQKWHRQSKIKYEDININLDTDFKNLKEQKLIDSGNDLLDVSSILELMLVGEIKQLAKDMNIKSNGSNKQSYVDSILKHVKNQTSLFMSKFDQRGLVLAKANKIIGSCIKVSIDPRKIFFRIFMLFSLVNCFENEDDLTSNSHNPLHMLTMINIGKNIFPEYRIFKKVPLFESRFELIRYTEALEMENDLVNCIANKEWDEGMKIHDNSWNKIESSCNNHRQLSSETKFLQKFTAAFVHCRCASHMVEILQKTRDYAGAVEKLKWLIKQEACSRKSKGYWYDRLALNLEQHLKLYSEAMCVIKEALESNIRDHDKISLSIRANRMNKNSSSKRKKKNVDVWRWHDMKLADIPQPLNITIRAEILPRYFNGINTVFIEKYTDCGSNSQENYRVHSVEQVALNHYKYAGFVDGIHGEGSTFITIYALLFWDIIYCDEIADVFRVPYQSYPLDLNTECFYESRKNLIDDRLLWLINANMEEVVDKVTKAWQDHFQQVSLVKWDRFENIDHLSSLLNCMNGKMLCDILKNFAQDFRGFRSGFPDLVVWNIAAKEIKVVEVKGPGDRLSTKQMVWLDLLKKSNISCEVCYVEDLHDGKVFKRARKCHQVLQGPWFKFARSFQEHSRNSSGHQENGTETCSGIFKKCYRTKGDHSF